MKKQEKIVRLEKYKKEKNGRFIRVVEVLKSLRQAR